MYAVIKNGGHQYRVEPGERVKIAKLEATVGERVTFDQVLMVGGDGETVVGTPLVEDARVKATVEEQGKDKKIIVYKFKRRKGYHKKQGHRQDFTAVRIDKVWVGQEPADDSGEE